MARVELNGLWAEIDETPLKWGQRNALRAAASRDFWADFAPALVSMTVTKWSLDTDPSDPTSWNPVDPEFGDAVFAEALKVWKARDEATDPNPTVQPSES